MGKISTLRNYRINQLGNITIPTLISSAGNSQNYVFSTTDNIYFEAEVYLNSYYVDGCPILEASSTTYGIVNEFSFQVIGTNGAGETRLLPVGSFCVYNGTRGQSLSIHYTDTAIINLDTWTKVTAKRINGVWSLFINDIECSVNRFNDSGVPNDQFGNIDLPVYIGRSEARNFNFDGQIRNIILGNKLINTKISIKKTNTGAGKLTYDRNYILNSKFNADNQYPIADGSIVFDSNYNMIGNCNDFDGCNILTNYKHNSPLFYEPIESHYQTFANRTFHEINAPYNILPIGHPIQPRLLKMFGAGSKFGRADNLTNYLKTITNTISFTPSDAQSWTKYGVEQMVIIPSWATKVVYGVKYLAKSDDLFRDNNFAGLKLNFRSSYFDGPYRNYVNIHLIRRSTAAAVDTLESLYGSNVYLYFSADSSSNAMCQWLGPQVTKVKVRKRSSTIIDANTDSFIKIKDTIDIPTFSSSSAEPDFGNGRPEFVSLEMFFAEWNTNLNDDLVSSGSIYFYEPFIYFV